MKSLRKATSFPFLLTAVPKGDDASQDSERQLDGRHQLVTSEDAQTAGRDSSEPQTVSVEWVKVVLAAKMHDQASVSSPTVRFYSPGSRSNERAVGSWYRTR